MTDQPRDWDREMSDIDRVIAKQGTAPPAGAPSLPRRAAWLPAGCRRRQGDTWR